MKLVLLPVALFLFFGCSSSKLSTAPQEQDTQLDVALQVEPGTSESPVDDIEPQVPLCEYNHTGFVELVNSGNRPVTCLIGDNLLFDVAAGQTARYEIPMGAYTVEWRVGNHTCHISDEIVPMCKTLKLAFDVKLAIGADIAR